MTREEFIDQWLPWHKAAFPGLDGWLATNAGELAAMTIEHWYNALESCRLDDAKAATSAMIASGDSPRGYTDHPRRVRDLASGYARDRGNAERQQQWGRFGGQETHACRYCADTGKVSIHVPASERERYVGAYGEAATARMPVSVRCVCSAGSGLLPHARQFRPDADELWDYPLPEGAQRAYPEGSLAAYCASLLGIPPNPDPKPRAEIQKERDRQLVGLVDEEIAF